MAPKRQQATDPGPAVSTTSTPLTPTTTSSTTTTTSKANISTGAVPLSPKASVAEIAQHILNRYLAQTSQRTFLLDAFMVFLVLVGGIQFVYCVVAGNYVRSIITIPPLLYYCPVYCFISGSCILTLGLRCSI